jgi:hypothetical protein
MIHADHILTTHILTSLDLVNKTLQHKFLIHSIVATLQQDTNIRYICAMHVIKAKTHPVHAFSLFRIAIKVKRDNNQPCLWLDGLLLAAS